MEQLDQIKESLGRAGQPTTFTPGMQELEKMRITPEKELPPMDFLFRLFGKPCFPRGELVAITGKAKSGKTFVTSMLMACCIMQKVLALEKNTASKGHTEITESTEMKPLRVLWYDTEQSDESTQDILKNRVLRMIGHTDLTDSTDLVVEKTFDVFNVRSQHWQQRRTLLAEAVRGYRPDLVIVDGIRDLVNDINDGVLAQEVMEELLHLATACNCCITCVLHQNKGSEDHNLRGWIGTELMNKAFEVYACEKLLPERIFKVEQTLTRKYDIEQCMYFTVGEDGLPTACGVPTGNTATENRERLPQLNSEYIVHDEDGNWQFDLQRLFLDAMRGEEEMRHFDLQQRVMGLSNIRNYQTLAKVFADAVDKKFIVKTKNAMGQVIYQPAPF